jgi:hypothetical protein
MFFSNRKLERRNGPDVTPTFSSLPLATRRFNSHGQPVLVLLG